ncbi:MAG: exosortase C-terminal domain/associated protein EpsI, partial [Myxococcota bacterium]
SSFPDEVGGWRCSTRETFSDEVLRNLRVTDYLSCAFYGETRDQAAHLYIGYHERQSRDRRTGAASSIHPPEHCLPGSGWDVIESSIVPIDAGGGGEAKRFVIAKGNQRSLVYFWYHSRGRVIARSHEKILYMFLDQARMGRSDGSLVRFTIPIYNGDIEVAERTFEKFSQNVTPLLAGYVPD